MTVQVLTRESGKEKGKHAEKMLIMLSVLFRKLSYCQKKSITSNDFIAWFSTPDNFEGHNGARMLEDVQATLSRFPFCHFIF